MARSSKSVASALSPRARYWRRLIAECSRSGLTQSAFCAARGVSPVTMSWWRGEFRFRDRDAARSRVLRTSRKSATARFVAVTVRPDTASTSPPQPPPIEVVLAGGRVVRIGARFDESELRRVVAALESVPSPSSC